MWTIPGWAKKSIFRGTTSKTQKGHRTDVVIFCHYMYICFRLEPRLRSKSNSLWNSCKSNLMLSPYCNTIPIFCHVLHLYCTLNKKKSLNGRCSRGCTGQSSLNEWTCSNNNWIKIHIYSTLHEESVFSIFLLECAIPQTLKIPEIGFQFQNGNCTSLLYRYTYTGNCHLL